MADALVTGKLLKAGLLVLAGSLVGIMSPLVLFVGDMFPGTPTLEAQYVFKDIVPVACVRQIRPPMPGSLMLSSPFSTWQAYRYSS